MAKINIHELKRIIQEEVTAAEKNYKAEKPVQDAVNKFLISIQSFESSCTNSMKSAVSSIMDDLKSQLENMRSNPSSYIENEPTKKKVISFKPNAG
jgi:nitrogenase molybdenum-iron protein alpha/beta subunit